MNRPVGQAFAFGPFRLDPHEQVLRRDNVPVALTPKAFDLLRHLVEHHGRLLSKEDLLRAVWPDTFVEEAVLSVNMSAIRKVLGDDRNGHTYIETVARRGYRFVAAVREIAADDDALPPAPAPEATPPPIDRSATLVMPQGRRLGTLVAAAALMMVIAVSIAVARYRHPTGNSIAVLPLESLSGDRDQTQFADAMTDLLITDLGRITSLRVVSRQSVVQYKTSRKSMPEIARELKVDYVAEGTVARDGDRVRITAQLIHGATDRHIWARSYERDLGGTFAMQSDVAESIAREIGVKLSVAPSSGNGDQRVPSAAYEAYLRGNYLASGGDSAGALKQFRTAVELYPEFAQAYARTASTYFNSGFFALEAPKDAFPHMREAALKAIEIDGSNAEAHAALAEAKLHYDWDWAGADREFRRSLEVNPSDSFVRHLYAHYKLTIGQPGESLDEMDRAFEIDPVGVFTAT